MTQQKWKTDPKLYDAPTEKRGVQIVKKLPLEVYRKEFLDCDPLRDWESISRCIWLWNWCMEQLGNVDCSDWAVLDIGTKDAQFPEWLRQQSIMSMGLEYSEPYVRYAINKGRPSMLGNACDMEFNDNTWDFVFSHHVHGLLPDYLKGLQEMYRVSKRYMVALNQVPGNPRKHYSYIESPKIYHDFATEISQRGDIKRIIYNDFLDTGFNNEWVIFVEKDVASESESELDIDSDEPDETFKKKKPTKSVGYFFGGE